MNKGQSLFEVVAALAVVALIIVALVSLVAKAVSNANFSRNQTLASRYSQEATEWLRGERDKDFDQFRTQASSSPQCLNNLSWGNIGICSDGEEISDTPFKREVTFTVSMVSAKTVIETLVKVYWSDSQGAHEARSVTNFSDWRQR